MSDYLGRLAARQLGSLPVLAPRLPLRFEPERAEPPVVEERSVTATRPPAPTALPPRPVAPAGTPPAAAGQVRARAGVPVPEPSPAPAPRRGAEAEATPPAPAPAAATAPDPQPIAEARREPIVIPVPTVVERLVSEAVEVTGERPPETLAASAPELVGQAPSAPAGSTRPARPNRPGQPPPLVAPRALPVTMPAHATGAPERLAQPPQTVVEVTIGRLEVRAAVPAKPYREPHDKPAPAIALEEYLDRRGRPARTRT